MQWMPTTGLHIITPEIAAEILAKCNIANRNIDPARVAAYASDIRNNDFSVNGETLKFSKRMRLMDGQHRLKAVVMSQMPIMSYVIADLEDTKEVFMTIDGGKPKSPGFHLKASGRANPTQLSATVASLRSYELGATGTAWRRPTTRERDRLVDKYGEQNIIDGIRAAQRCRINHRTALSALYVLGKIADANLRTNSTESFFAELDGTAATLAGQPAFALRNLYLNATFQRRTLTPVAELALAVKAWNLHARGMSCHHLRWRTKQSPDEPMPNLIGHPWTGGDCDPADDAAE